jgi:hypothetical protein
MIVREGQLAHAMKNERRDPLLPVITLLGQHRVLIG